MSEALSYLAALEEGEVLDEDGRRVPIKQFLRAKSWPPFHTNLKGHPVLGLNSTNTLKTLHEPKSTRNYPT
jgi:hypothetical protein